MMHTLSPQEFDRLALKVWQELLPLIPAELKSHFDKIQILIDDEPSTEVLAELKDTDLADDPDLLCGLHLGVPITEQSATFPALFPARVFLFRWALQDLVEFDGTREAHLRLREEVAVTLLHEIGHFFGLEEADLERLDFG